MLSNATFTINTRQHDHSKHNMLFCIFSAGPTTCRANYLEARFQGCNQASIIKHPISSDVVRMSLIAVAFYRTNPQPKGIFPGHSMCFVASLFCFSRVSGPGTYIVKLFMKMAVECNLQNPYTSIVSAGTTTCRAN